MKNQIFERFANTATRFTGSSAAIMAATIIVVIWAISGPFFGYSETWQLIINTGTTIITFLMVFLIQKAQNKDSKAIQLKLNELIASHKNASNRMIDIEEITEKELDDLHLFYRKLAELAAREIDFNKVFSPDSAEEIHEEKKSAISPLKIKKNPKHDKTDHSAYTYKG